MKWFEESIHLAVHKSKTTKAIFVVFVEGKDDASAQFMQALNVAEVSKYFENEDFVAVKLESGSEQYRFFAQIYHLVPVPSLFFIGVNGIPLEIIVGNTTATELTSKIESVLIKSGKKCQDSSFNLIESEKKSSELTNTPDASTSEVTTDTEKVTEKEDVPEKSTETVTKTEVENKPEESTSTDVKETDMKETDVKEADLKETDVKDTDVKETDVKETDVKEIDAPTTSNETKEDSDTDLTMQEKLDRARQLIEAQKKQRQEEEEKKHKEKELERRKLGREMQKMKQMQQDWQVKKAQEERRKEKAAENAAREKVRLQIAQDKLERKQKELALQPKQSSPPPSEQPKTRPAWLTDATITRIQFRLPSGNPHMAPFSPSDTLSILRTYVTENIDLPFRQFVMSTSFPRRNLTDEDDKKTLLELELVPRAVILILPLKNNNTKANTTSVTSAQDVGFFSRFMWSLFAPVIGIYNYLMGYFNKTLNGNTDPNNEDSANSSNGPNTGEESTFPNLQNITRSTGNLNGATIRAQGNIHRLHTDGDDNDENNTWNGNSTQQM
ncbi:PREDICTED: UBX domain-containing protein 4 isoform X2 [Polistes canadensis]|uniref:UBX domain-containing protein 4 isoform X2 n=1 Tax=Polistes canadensis TaxID=91411 RepID=UPI000718F11A|nr:PREDICTED: UBX domain-containing protein 4 isoform X2 [Polistes canadensis]